MLKVVGKERCKDYSTALIAGSVGTEIFSSGDKSLSENGTRDSARSALGWWWVYKKEVEEANQRGPPLGSGGYLKRRNQRYTVT